MNNPTPQPTTVPRITGLLILEVRKSNPNGDPERESSPRQRPDGKGEISPVSIKRKLRDLVEVKPEAVWEMIQKRVSLPSGFDYDIMESRERGWKELKDQDEQKRANEAWGKTSEVLRADFPKFKAKYWDARLFGNTFLEKAKEDSGIQNTIRSGVAHFGVGISLAPIEIEFSTWTKKAPAQEDKTRGMAPMAFKVLKHGIYTVPFFVNPSQAAKTGCTAEDISIMVNLLPFIYSHSTSVIRTMIDVRHVHCVQHQENVGSFSDFALIDALTPKRKPEFDVTKPSESADEYNFPTWKDIEGTSPRDGRPVFKDLGTYHDYAL
ncbi:MAG TPA: type I CRISPR-associated protein Cas7 [Terrimicrobiaceae bacterium]